MHTRLFVALTAVLLVVGLTTLTVSFIPTVHAEEGGGGGGGGGDGGGSSGGSSDSGGGSGGGHGAHRGHSTTAAYHVARWLASQYSLGLTGAFGGTSNAVPLSTDETAYICSMQKYLKRLGVNLVRADIVAVIADAMHRSPEVVEHALRSPTLCK